MAAPLDMDARGMTEPAATNRERRIRAKNRALLIVLIGLVALFYAIAMVRMGG
jgi:hypothetical protein